MKLAIDKEEHPFTVKEVENFLTAARAIGADDETIVYMPDHHSTEMSVDF